MSSIYLVARRDYLAYVGAWGFWLSLIMAPLLLAALLFGPVMLARAEPSRVLSIIADRPDDARLVREVFAGEARDDARGEVLAYLAAAAPSLVEDATAAFDAGPDGPAAVAAARAIVAQRAPGALGAFPEWAPRYLIAPPPAPDIEALKPYLVGAQSIPIAGEARPLFGVVRIRREADTPVIEYWSVNLSHGEPSNIAARAMRLAMRRDSLAAQGLAPQAADALDALRPRVTQFDPRSGAGEAAVTLRQRAPFYAALALAFVLWSVVFSAANMLLGGVVEERSNKILDTLLTSVTPLEILVGKLIGVAAVSATLFLVWGAVGGVLLNLAAARAADDAIGQIASAFLDPRLLTAFGIGFVAGYLMYGAIFLALGSLCESIQEAQTLLGPVSLVLAMPMMLVAPALDNPNAPIVTAASWFPLFTPFLLLVRAPAGLDWVEIVGMGALMCTAVVLVLMLATRVFRAGVVEQASFGSLRRRFTGGRTKS